MMATEQTSEGMGPERFVSLANEYQGLGFAAQGQLADLLADGSLDEQNPNALRMILTFLRNAGDDLAGGEELADEIEEFLDGDDAA